ncbi:unnamed protein product [Hermetia illucens]|uniref:CAAX prenyl protease 2 n=1 Tax=Hermetia illucens TaxID=343691 RepID=A0A7R8YWW8_HERIL|nr:CAAX prenyl protease 2 [Hermetia illucens]CAD7085215.1 unnamed protein product [Hermetia illucens]
MESSAVELSQLSPLISVGCCFILSIIYVSSLYVWNSDQNRDHPSTVKRRFFSVFIVMLLSPAFVYKFSLGAKVFKDVTLAAILGFRTEGFLLATIVPILLTSLLFLGPLVAQAFNESWRVSVSHNNWLNNFTNVLWLRNFLVAPLSEEFTFRACMMPLLLQSFTPSTAVLITPLFFGVAHFHHMIERLRSGMDMKTAIIISCFQFTYTTIFGFYSAYLFVRTGHFVAPFVAHAFCNHMGFPDINDVILHKNYMRYVLIALYVTGLVLWILVLPVATTPSFYANNLYWKT